MQPDWNSAFSAEREKRITGMNPPRMDTHQFALSKANTRK